MSTARDSRRPVCVTLASLAAIEPRFAGQPLSWLSEEERARFETFNAWGRKRQFLAGRFLARQCLASWTGRLWKAHRLSAPEDAGPSLVAFKAYGSNLSDALHLSLSHSADWLACAVAAWPIGVDIEDDTRPRNTDALAELVLGSDERIEMAAVEPLLERRKRFFARWTLKEARIKQLGRAAPDAMRAIQCFPSAPGEETDGVVVVGTGLTLAVAGSSAGQLVLEGALPTGLAKQGWRFVSGP